MLGSAGAAGLAGFVAYTRVAQVGLPCSACGCSGWAAAADTAPGLQAQQALRDPSSPAGQQEGGRRPLQRPLVQAARQAAEDGRSRAIALDQAQPDGRQAGRAAELPEALQEDGGTNAGEPD